MSHFMRFVHETVGMMQEKRLHLGPFGENDRAQSIPGLTIYVTAEISGNVQRSKKARISDVGFRTALEQRSGRLLGTKSAASM